MTGIQQFETEDERLVSPYDDDSVIKTYTQWAILHAGDSFVRTSYVGEAQARRNLQPGDALVCCTVEVETVTRYSDYRVVEEKP